MRPARKERTVQARRRQLEPRDRELATDVGRGQVRSRHELDLRRAELLREAVISAHACEHLVDPVVECAGRRVDEHELLLGTDGQ